MPGYNTSPKGGYTGNGRSQAARRFAWPTRADRSKGGAYLKEFGSRPEYKRKRMGRAA